MDGKKYLSIGTISKGHGLKGEVRLNPSVEAIEVLDEVNQVRVQHTDGGETNMQLLSWRRQGEKLLVQLEGVGDRSSADALRGANLAIDRDLLPPPSEDTYFLDDLLGYAMVTDDGREIGEVIAVAELPASPVLTVAYQGREVLIPLVEQFVTGIRHREKVITIHLLEGLLELP